MGAPKGRVVEPHEVSTVLKLSTTGRVVHDLGSAGCFVKTAFVEIV